MKFIKRSSSKKKATTDNECWKNLSDYTKINLNENVTENSFVQGKLGNCGMIASMASLASNLDIYNKVVPKNQHGYSLHYTRNSSEFTFVLYKNGHRHYVKVNDSLPHIGSTLKYSCSFSNNSVGPLLEKALVKLHFQGNYESAEGVKAHHILTSFTNNFFEKYFNISTDLTCNLHDVIHHGMITRSLMVVTFKKNVRKYSVSQGHYYTVLEMNEKLVKLYNPHGETIFLSISKFLKKIYKLEISYFENKIFMMPEIETLEEFWETWPELQINNKISFIVYDLLVKEDDTEMLINLIEKNDHKMQRVILIIAENEKENAVGKNKQVLSTSCLKHLQNIHYKPSLRQNLNKGKYKIVVTFSKYKYTNLYDDRNCLEYLNNGGNKMLFRFASSKHCTVNKTISKENEIIEQTITRWFRKALSYQRSNLLNVLLLH